MRSINNKFDELCCQVFTLDAGVLICTETWLNDDFPPEAFSIPGYTCFRGDRRNGSRRGGVAIWSKTRLRAEALCLPTSNHLEICGVQIPDSKLMIIGIYLPPGIASNDFDAFHDTLLSTLDDILVTMPLYRLIIAGDFNQYDIAPLSLHLSLKNIVTGPTRENSCLDLILVDTRLLDDYSQERTDIGPPIGRSDHRCVFARPGEGVNRRCINKHILYDLRLSHVLAFEQRFLSGNLNTLYSHDDIEEKCDTFYKILNIALEEIPRTEVYLTNSDAPWMTPLIKNLIDRRWEAYRFRNWSLYNTLKVKVKRAICRAKLAFFKKRKETTKGLWSLVNMERGSTCNDLNLLFKDASSPQSVLDKFNDYYCSFMNSGSPTSNDQCICDDGWCPSVSVFDVWRMLSRLPSIAVGSDDIPTLLYKKCALILAEPIHHLIVECLRQRKLPSKWKIADITPIPKSSEIAVTNTRPISLLPIPAKMVEKIVLLNIRDCLSCLLGDLQYAIRRKSSTSHAIIAAHDALTKLADNSQIGAALFISFDFSKAFDMVNHSLLLTKLRRMNLPSGFVIFMENYLSNRFQRVRLNGFKSDLRCITSGVPQGSLLGPYLFGLYVSSLQPIHQSTCMVKYMDDVCVITGVRKAHPLEDITRIKSEINNILTWSTSNCLKLNISKTNGLIKYKGHFMDKCDIESCIPSVKFVHCLRFLGVILEDSLRWTSHITYILKKSAQRLYILRRMKMVVSKEECILIYNGLIRSLMEYACPAFIGLSVQDAKRLQAMQNRCFKVLGQDAIMDLDSRRRNMAFRLFEGLSEQHTFIKDLLPPSLPSGRLSVIFCNSSLRRSSFMPKMSILVSSSYCD